MAFSSIVDISGEPTAEEAIAVLHDYSNSGAAIGSQALNAISKINFTDEQLASIATTALKGLDDQSGRGFPYDAQHWLALRTWALGQTR